ncbi:hypothetical protein D9Q98_001096 [Chlorella vulgaris]|uniref:16S rRNA (uracil(1498)-N(3))-methyltransferase n=1 Tax=Chlorella vulgaris TaxID=3077 RepID=A0A9D4TZZ1_CHLVU|nr:hypothetical protein D9Q98_001096 [Chlorella vulgaris]
MAASLSSAVVSPLASQLPRFYIPTPLATAAAGSMLRLPPDESRHAIKTLRLREGDRIELCDGRGWVTTAQIAELGDRAGAVVHALDPGPLLVPRTGWQWEVACACGSLKGGRSDWLVEKCAELGAAAFVPLLTQRSPNIGSADPGGGDGGKAERRGGKSGRRRAGEEEEEEEEGASVAGSGRVGRWERVAVAAMKQCLRTHGMPISRPCSVQQLCERIRNGETALLGVAGAPPLPSVVAQLQLRPSEGGSASGVLCIGPEGDWTAAELAALVEAGAQPVGLGPLRLRAETAAIALLSYVKLLLP